MGAQLGGDRGRRGGEAIKRELAASSALRTSPGRRGSVDYNCLVVVLEVAVKKRRRQEEL